MVSGAGACDGGTHHGGCTWQRRPLTSVVLGKGEIGEREERVPMASQGHSTNDLIAERLMFLPSSRSCCRPRTKHGTHQTGLEIVAQWQIICKSVPNPWFNLQQHSHSHLKQVTQNLGYYSTEEGKPRDPTFGAKECQPKGRGGGTDCPTRVPEGSWPANTLVLPQ